MIAVTASGEFASTTLNALTVVFSSTSDLDANHLLSTVTLNTTNLALIADSDNDGNGNLYLPDSVSVIGDLRIEGHTISAFDAMQLETNINLTANRLLISSDRSAVSRRM